jgi:PAS domain S-box-containing protein
MKREGAHEAPKPPETAGVPVALEERVQALETELRQREVLLEAAFASSYDGLAILSAEGVFLEINEAFARLTGTERGDWIGRHLDEMQRKPGIPRRSASRQVMAGSWPATTLVNARDGESVLITASPHLGANGEVQHIVLNLRNITRLNHLKYQLERDRGESKVASIAQRRAEYLGSRLRAAGLSDVVCASALFSDVLLTAAEIAEFDSTVLLYGETGTGKGVVARLLHQLSLRADKPFIELNCGALPESLVESELFGYEPGAFTGALRGGKKGQFEVANGGTIFLDEIGELPLASQSKLLAVLEDKVVRRVGGTSSRRVDVRIICATNRDLRELVAAGRFREDLHYRLEVIPLVIPPLRERPEDVKALAYAFLERMNRQFSRSHALSLEAVSALMRHDFPGNVRELRNLLERLVMITRNQEIGLDDLPEHLRRLAPRSSLAEENVAELAAESADRVAYRARVEALERKLLSHYASLSRSTYELAERTGLHQSSVVRKLKKYGIRVRGTGAGD